MEEALRTDDVHHPGAAICGRHEKTWTKYGEERDISNQENAQ